MSLDEALDRCRTGALAFKRQSDGALLLMPTLCHRWSCPYCRAHRYAQAQARAVAGRPQRMITLTLRADDHADPLDMARRLRTAWTRLVARIRRLGLPFEYFAALELTKKRTPHLHILQRGAFIDQKWLSAAWSNLTGSYVVHIRKIDHVPNAVQETVKYLAKTADQIEALEANLPVFTHSRGWLPPDFTDATEPTGEWDFLAHLNLSWSDISEICDSLGLALQEVEPGSRVCTPVPLGPWNENTAQSIIELGSYAELHLVLLLREARKAALGSTARFEDAEYTFDYLTADPDNDQEWSPCRPTAFPAPLPPVTSLTSQTSLSL